MLENLRKGPYLIYQVQRLRNTACFFLFLNRHFYYIFIVDANFVVHPKSAICETLGGEVNFTCNATGTPHPNVSWEKNGKELDESSSVKIVTDGKGYSKLTIKNCGEVAALARYRCKATNPPDLKVFSEPAVTFFACKCLYCARLTPLHVHDCYCYSNFL